MFHFSRSGSWRQTFRYYEQMDAVMGTRPITEPVNYVDTEDFQSPRVTKVGIRGENVIVFHSLETLNMLFEK